MKTYLLSAIVKDELYRFMYFFEKKVCFSDMSEEEINKLMEMQFCYHIGGPRLYLRLQFASLELIGHPHVFLRIPRLQFLTMQSIQ